MRHFFFFDIDLYCYVFPLHCFSCTLQILACHLHFQSVQNTFWFLFWFLLQPMGYWKYVLWFLNIWGYSRDFFAINSNFIQLWSKKILYRSWVLFNLLRLVLWHRMWTILGDVLCESEKNVHSATVGWSVYKCQLVDCIAQVLHILTDFLLVQLLRRVLEISNCNCRLPDFFFFLGCTMQRAGS